MIGNFADPSVTVALPVGAGVTSSDFSAPVNPESSFTDVLCPVRLGIVATGGGPDCANARPEPTPVRASAATPAAAIMRIFIGRSPSVGPASPPESTYLRAPGLTCSTQLS